MAFISVSGDPASRHEDLARSVAQRLHYELVTEARLRQLLASEFGAGAQIPDKAYPHAASSILVQLATQYHLVVSAPGAERMFAHFPGVLRVLVTASEARRVGNLMLDQRLERAPARALLEELSARQVADTRKQFGRAKLPLSHFDLMLNAESFGADAASIVAAAAEARGLPGEGLLSQPAAAQMQFQLRMELARHGMVPAGQASLERKPFGHPSEQIFANLLDFYRIAWEYEPRSFPLQWDKDGNVTEAFTPDFFLPDLDLYVELTTMKQALVTRKNRKIKLLRAIYPHVNIQVFYQKDFQDLIFKHGLTQPAGAL